MLIPSGSRFQCLADESECDTESMPGIDRGGRRRLSLTWTGRPCSLDGAGNARAAGLSYAGFHAGVAGVTSVEVTCMRWLVTAGIVEGSLCVTAP